ncbi:hypothetical protein Tco_1406568 [Tanacetum coccineum]
MVKQYLTLSVHKFQQFQTASISANNAKFPYMEKDKYEIWAMKMEYWIQNADHNLWRIVQQGNSPKRLGKDAKGNYNYHPLSLVMSCCCTRENKVRNLIASGSSEDHMTQCSIIMMMQGIFGWQLRLEHFLSWSQVDLALKNKRWSESCSFDDLYNKLRSLELDVRIGHSYGVKAAAAPTHSAFIGAASSGSKLNYSNQQSIPSGSQTSVRSDSIMKCVLHSFVAENEPDQDMIYEDFDQVMETVTQDEPKALVLS